MAVGSCPCVACGVRQLVPWVRTQQVSLYRCEACDGLTALPRPDPGTLAEYHNSDAYFSHPYFERRRHDQERAEARCRGIVASLSLVKSNLALAGVRHLDVGCDTGALLEAFATLYRTEPVGVDVSARAVAMAQARGIEAHRTALDGVGDVGRFGLVTLVDVIEHVPDPVGLLADVSRRLHPEGICYVETPNIRSMVYVTGHLLARLTEGRPAWLCDRLFLPEHVQYLSPDGLQAIAKSAGLKIASLGRRVLGAADVNASSAVTAGVQILQVADRALGREILHCAVLVP